MNSGHRVEKWSVRIFRGLTEARTVRLEVVNKGGRIWADVSEVHNLSSFPQKQ